MAVRGQFVGWCALILVQLLACDAQVTVQCDQEYTAKTQTLQSDNPYANDLNCKFYINYETGLQITINFTRFELEYKSDHLYIGQGGPEDVDIESALYEFSGSPGDAKHPDGDIVIESGHVWFLFQTDYDGVEAGFRFTYTALDFCEETVENGGPSGEITSPMYPAPYGSGYSCEEHVHVSADARILLQFYDVDIDEGDVLTVNDGGQLWNLTGSNLPKDYLTASHNLVLIFTSDNSFNNSGRGYRLGYKEVRIVTPIPKGPLMDYTFVKMTGFKLSSSDYPRDYSDNSLYQFTVTAPTNRIHVHLFDLNLEEKYDMLMIGAGDTVNENVRYTFGGNPTTEPDIIHIQANSSWVWFKSDYNGTSRGFNIFFEPHVMDHKPPPPDFGTDPIELCGTDLVIKDAVNISHPEYPDSYNDNTLCNWKITNKDKGERLRLRFLEFDTEDSFDLLEIGLGADATSWNSRYQMFSGIRYSPVMVLPSDSIWIKFSSDYSNVSSGFNIQIEQALDPACYQVIVLDAATTNTTITTPGYGEGGYADNTYCQWIIMAPSGSRLGVRFEGVFDTEDEYDLLEIGTGDKPGYLDTRQKVYSGNWAEDFLADYDTMWVTFTSDESGTGDGCQLTVEIEPACGVVTLHEESGVITSPWYPDMYPNDADCFWIIQVDGRFTIRLTFDEFDLESGHDKLYIGGVDVPADGVSDYLVMTGDTSKTIQSNYNGINLRFKSDRSNRAKGFRINYEQVYECQEGWEFGPDGDCYKFVSGSKSWLDARYECDNVGEGDLAIVNNQEELDYIMARMANVTGTSDSFWVGAYDAAVEGAFEWGDCSTSTFFLNSNFNGQTTNEEKDCAFYDPINDYFDDSECETMFPFVCEVTPLDNLDIYPRNLEGASLGTRSALLQWAVSPVNCDIDAYRVRYNTSASEYEYLLSPGAFSESLLIDGLQPGTLYNFEMTIVTFTYGNYSFRTAKSVMVLTDPLPTCPPGYILAADDACYKFSMTARSWRDARLDCASEQDSDLVNIETAGENEALRDVLADSDSYWINLFDEVTPDTFQWATSCAAPTLYSNWEQDSPSTGEAGANKGCVEIDGDSGEWRDNDCTLTRMYICEIRSRATDIRDLSPTNVAAQTRGYDSVFAAWAIGLRTCDVTGYDIIATFNDSSPGTVTEHIPGGESANGLIYGLPGETDVTIVVGAVSYTFGSLAPLEDEYADVTTLPLPLCPPYYTRGYDQECYRIVEGALSWFDARAVCRQVEHGDLALIETQEELDYILGVATQGAWWIGMTDLAVEDNFRWVTCDPVTGWAAQNWGMGQPSDTDMSENCVLFDNGMWSDSNCDNLFNYVCEINEKDFDSIDANPTNIMAAPKSLTSLEVTWDVSEYTCDLTGYQLWVNSDVMSSPRVENIWGALTTSYELKDLIPDTEYRLRMAAASGGIVQDFTLPEVVVRTANESSGLCPQDHQRLYMDNCYKFGVEPKTWDAARADCQRLGGDLMVVSDSGEYDFIVDLAGNVEWWMGLYDKAEEDSWRWVDCTNKDSSDWFGGEPDDYGKQDCAYLQDGFFYDWQCEDSFPYVCELMDKGFEPGDANPSKASYTPVSYDTVQAAWTVSPYNCEVTGYKISYVPVQSVDPPEVVEVPGGSTDSFEVRGLWPETVYQFQIAATTLSGDLNYTETGTARTTAFTAPACVAPVNVTSEYGVIQSPYYPELYPPSLDCTWEFRYSQGKRLQLEFLTWAITDSDDYLEIVELSPEHASRPATRLTGAASPDLFKSFGNQVSVRFVSDDDSRGLGTGFEIAYAAIEEALPEDKDCDAELTLKANSFLTIESEGYPQTYEEFEDCTWVVRSSGTGLGVTLNLLDIDFDGSEGDYLEVGTGDTVSTQTLVHRFTALEEESVDLQSGVIWINFRTDGGDSGKGFSIRAQDYAVVQPKITGDTLMQDEDIMEVNGMCGETVDVPTGFREEVTSPGYESGGYNNSEDCLWILDARNGYRFRLTFFDFDVEFGYDFVEVGYGENPEDSSTLLLRATGTSLPDSMMIPDDAGWVHFWSDESTTSKGFGFYVQEDTACYTSHDLPLGGSFSFQTPNYPNNYDVDEYCWWEINGDYRQNLRVEIEDFSTEEGFDLVEMGIGGAPLLYSRYLAASGTMPQESISVGYFRTWVTFTSDSSMQAKGFKMTVYDDSCLDQTVSGPTGLIASPGFGDAYYNNLDCRWTITVSVGYQIRLTFSAFDLEYGRDFLYISGTVDAPLEAWPLTGSEIPDPVSSASNVLTLNLNTDFSTTAGGFNLTYEEIYYCPDGFEAGEGHDGISCYYLGTTPKSWTDARAHCRSFEDADLVIVENALENRHIKSLTAGEDLWIGFYDAQVENIFNWVDCVTSPNGFAIYNWNLTQPDNANGNEDCAAILGVKEAGYYADFPCNRQLKYVCERVPNRVPVDPSSGNPTAVSAKATSQTSIRVMWTPASVTDNCDQTGYAVHYTNEQGTTMTETFDGVATELGDLSGLGINEYYTIKVVAYTFSTGMGAREDTITVRTLSPIETYCPEGWTQGPDFTCFYFSEADDTRSFHDARHICGHTPMGDLAVLDTPEELAFVENQTSTNPYWIGLNDLAVEGDFRWSDCQAISIWQQLNFAVGEPDDSDGTQNCVAINSAGNFIDTQCSGRWQYVCELVEKDFVFEDQFPLSFTVNPVSALAIRATWVASAYTCDLLGYKITYTDGIGFSGQVVTDDPLSGTLLIEGLTPDTNYAVGIVPFNTAGDLPMFGETNVYTLPVSSLCPEEYIVGYNYGCYQFISEHRTWADARTHCQQAIKGDLAIVDDPDEMDFLLDNQLLEGFEWWIGMSDRQHEGMFHWVDCSHLNNVSESWWAPGQPSDVGGSDNCVQLSDSGEFNDRDCKSFFPFVCEINESNFLPEESVPSLFRGSPGSHISVDLTWVVSSQDCELSGYRVYYRQVGGGTWSSVWVPGPTSSSVTISNLEIETTYEFQLRSVNLEGEELATYSETTVTTNPAPPCPLLYQRGPDQECYRFAQMAASWAEARASCREVDNGELVVIDSQEKLDYITSQTLTGDWWIGAYDQATEGRWRWVDCADFNAFSTGNWASGQPSGSTGEDCAALLPSGEFNDWPCDSQVNYICQTVYKEFDREDANPSNLAATVASFTSIEVTWSPSPYNCDVTGYTIWATVDADISEPVEYIVSGGDTDKFEVMDLLPETSYEFSVAAITLYGPLQYIMPLAKATLPDETANLCPQGYRKLYNNGCYKISSHMHTWFDARTDCQSTPESDLIIINDAAEDAYFRNIGAGSDWWIGLSDFGVEGDFRWIDCSAPTFDNWGSGEPDNYDDNEDCVLITPGWSWNDWDCTARVMYICEISKNSDVDPVDANPSSFSLSPQSYSQVQVSWLLGAKACDNLGYNIRYRQVGTAQFFETYVEGGDVTEYVIGSLRPQTNYQIGIGARTWTGGNLPYLDSKVVSLPSFDDPGCDGTPATIDHGAGNLSSPLSPDFYPPSVECTYIFDFDEGSRIEFQYFLWVLTDANDYLEITELNPEFADVPTKILTGFATPKIYLSYGNRIQVRFVSDAATETPGYIILYRPVEVGIPAPKCGDDYTLKENAEPLLIQSGGYPNGYAPYVDCAWILRAGDLSNAVALDIYDIDLEENSDWVDIGTGADPTDASSRLFRYDGSQVPEDIVYTEGNTAWVRFRSDNSFSGDGISFGALEWSGNAVPTKGPGGESDIVVNAVCDLTINVPLGGGATVIHTPGYPNDYGNNEACVWSIIGNQGRRFKLAFDSFDTEEGYDFIEVTTHVQPIEGIGLTWPLLRTSGSSVPGDIVFDNQYGTIRFNSDQSGTAAGFQLRILEDTGCEGVVTVPADGSVTFSTPGYPITPYVNNEYCFWTVQGQPGVNLRGHIDGIGLESGYDYVDMGWGNSTTDLDSRLVKSSDLAEESFSIGADTAWVIFASDGSVRDDGLQMTFYDDSCSNQALSGEMGLIQSPGFGPGSEYFNLLSCRWTITVAEPYHVGITFQSFDLETDRDFLLVTGAIEAPLDALRLTGNTLPGKIVSSRTILILDFETDGSTTRAGFELTWMQDYNCPEGYSEGTGSYGPACYKFGATPKTWQAARQDCRTTPNSDLAIIENALENRYIRDLSGGEDHWIGIYDASVERAFVHTDCVSNLRRYGRSNWNSSQPDGIVGGEQDCVAMLGANEPGYYADFTCARLKKYVCEVQDAGVIYDPTGATPEDVDGEGTSISSIRVRWHLADLDDCDLIGFTAFYSGAGGPTLSTSVEGSDATFIDIEGLQASTTYTVSIWANTFSFGPISNTAEIQVSTLSIADEYCPDGYEEGPDYSCYRVSPAVMTWQSAREACRSDDPDSDLAVIETQAEVDYLLTKTNGTAGYWIGLNDLSVEARFYWTDCSIVSLVTNSWQARNWAEGEPSGQDCGTLTANGQWADELCTLHKKYICEVVPKPYALEDQYPSNFDFTITSALTAQATWVPSPRFTCDILGYRVFVSDGLSPEIVAESLGGTSFAVRIMGLQPDTNYAVSWAPFNAYGDLPRVWEPFNFDTPTVDTLCDDGYIVGYDYGCYKFVSDQSLSWSDARAECQMKARGDLAIVDDADEMEFIVDAGLTVGFDWWIGLSDRASEGEYYWPDCSAASNFTLNSWDLQQPSDIDGSENCVVLQDNHKLNDRDCERTFPYICEISPTNFDERLSYPVTFQSAAVDENTIQLSWIPSPLNCDITGYRITYYNDPSSKMYMSVPGADTAGAIVGELLADTVYTFNLAVVTPDGITNDISQTATATLPPINPCPEGWVVGYLGRCYRFGASAKDYWGAREDCRSVENGDLVVIETGMENEFIYNLTQGGMWWIGYNDIAIEGAFSWVDCDAATVFAESNWELGQPDDMLGNQDCTILTNSGRYNDWDCAEPIKYICEQSPKGYAPEDANPRSVSAAAVNPSTIEVSWVPESRYNCDVLGYRVIYPNPTPVVVDVPGADTTSVTITGLMDDTTYWVSVGAYTYFEDLPYINDTSVTTPNSNDLCEEGWVPGYDYKCYKFGTDSLSWEDARLDCQSLQDGDLAVFETEAEWDYVSNLGAGVSWWLGLFDRATEGDYRWVTCDPLGEWASDKWASGQPNDLQGNQDCVQMMGSGLLNDLECSAESFYVCEVTMKDFTVDDQSPSLLRGEALDPTTVELTWTLSEYTCEVLGYVIYIQLGIDTQTQMVEGGEIASTLVKDLEPTETYVFDIAAYTTYTTLPATGKTARVTMPSTSSGECGPDSYTDSSGVILSPNYPDPYSDNLQCSYIITLPDPAMVVKLFIIDFELENGHDFLTIGLGNVIFENTEMTLTGSEVVSEITTSSSMVWLFFSSDESVSAGGFSISFESLEGASTGEEVGAATVKISGETPETFAEMEEMFKTSVASQMNAFCAESEDNCLTEPGVAFTAEDVIIVGVEEVEGGVEVTFWVRDPMDETGRSAALTSTQLEDGLSVKEEDIEDGGGFDMVIIGGNSSAFSEPWVIGTTCAVGFCVLLLLLVLMRNCLCPRTKGSKAGSTSSSVSTDDRDVEMVDTQKNNDPWSEGAAYSNPAVDTKDEIQREAVEDDPETLYTVSSNRKSTGKGTTQAQVESSSGEGSTSSALEDTNEPLSSASSERQGDKDDDTIM